MNSISYLLRFKPNWTKHLVLSSRRMQSTVVSNLSIDELQLTKTNQVGCILVNRPKQLNAINLSIVKQMQKQIEYCENDKDIKCIIVKGAGDKAFCAGGDVKTIRDNCLNGERKKAMEFFGEEYKLNFQIANCKKPYIALINGITMGGGVGISIHGKFRVANENTVFAMPETLIGFFADVGGTYFLSRLEDSLGPYLVLTGHRLKGVETKQVGIATHFTNSVKMKQLEEALCQETSKNLNDPSVVEHILKQFEDAESQVKQLDLDRHKINKIFGSDTLESIYQQLESDGSEWSKRQLKQMNKMSPTSLKVAVRQLKLGKSLSLRECLQLEYQLCLRFTKSNDFVEGVRAVLVDKDNNPKWMPDRYEKVDTALLDWYFQAQPDDETVNFDIKQSKL